MGLIDKGKELLGLDTKNTIDKEKEENMGAYQGDKSKLDYKKVNDAINKIKNNSKQKNNFDSVKSNLNNFTKSFNDLKIEEKQEELKSEKFRSLFNDIDSLKDNSLKKIIDSMENQRELSEYENLSKQIEVLTNKLDAIGEKDLKNQNYDMNDIGSSTDAISEVINKNFWDTLKKSIQIPKVDLSSITQKIDSIKNDINNSNQALSKKIDNIKIPSIPSFPKIPNDYLKKDDFEFIIKDKLQDLKGIKESSEDLESVPAKVNSIEKELKVLSEKMDNLPSSNASQAPKHIPKEEKSVIELAKYMTDGVAQFENIAKEYISKIEELKKLDKIKDKHQNELEKVQKEEFNNGKEAGKIELIKNLAEKFPTEFKVIQSTFEDLLEEKFEKDKTLEIDDKNINKMLSFIENKIENGKYKVISPALLVDKEILFKANVEKVD